MVFCVNYFKKSGADSIWDTIAHEVIHTVPGCFNHGDGFKAAARCLEKHGYHVGRLCRDEEYAKYITQKKAFGTTYHVVCEDCGWDGTRRKKLSKILKGIMQEGQRRYSTRFACEGAPPQGWRTRSNLSSWDAQKEKQTGQCQSAFACSGVRLTG